MFWKHLDEFQEKLEELLEEFHTWGHLKFKAEMFVDYICSPKTCKQQAKGNLLRVSIDYCSCLQQKRVFRSLSLFWDFQSIFVALNKKID